RLTVRVDLSEPATVDEPEILRDDDGRSGTLYWPGTQDRDVFVSLPHLTAGFVRAEETVSWLVPDDLSRITVLYFLIDEFGRRSETRTLHIDTQIPPAPPSFVGVRDGAVYTAPQTVRIEADGPVRYTMTTDGSEPPAVHPLSTRYENPIELVAAPGEDRSYRLRAQRADSAGENPADATLTVRIDRARPAAPQLLDVVSGSFFSEETELTFEPPNAGVVFYRLTPGSAPRNGRYRQYDGETDIRIDAAPGELRSYVLEAYAVDGAGNRSQTVSMWELFVDREIVYVDSAREDPGRGTRDDPFSDLNEALRVVRDSGRRTVFLTAGTHRAAPALLRDAVSAAGNITISGGYIGETWEINGDETILEVDPVEPISIVGDIRLQQLLFGASIEEISVHAGNLTIENIGTSGPSQLRPRISVHDGTVNLHSVHLPEIVLERASSESGSPAELTAGVFGRIEVAGGDLRITESTVGGLHLRESATVLVSDSAITFGTEDTFGGRDGAGTSVVPVPLVTISESALQLRRSTVSALARLDPVVLLRATDASLDIADSYLVAAGNDLLYGITARRSTVTVQNSYLGLFGGTEQSGIVSGAGSLYVSDSLVVNHESREVPARAFHVTAVGSPTPRIQRVLLLRDRAGDESATRARSTSAITRQARAGDDSTAAAIRLVNDALVDSRDVIMFGWDAFIDRGRSAGNWEPDEAERRNSVRSLADRSLIDPLFLMPSDEAISDSEARADIVQRVAETLSRLFATGD
nr:chitobiase/beta-hexosaminidase C-terminal domain-containing protein [Spirochaeta sp.]